MSKKVKQPVNAQSGRESAIQSAVPSSPSLPGARDGLGPKERRFSAQKKAEAVERLLRGESLDVLSRELAVTAATLSDWRDTFRTAGEAALKSRQPSAQDDEILHLKAMIGDLAMRNELLVERSRLAEAASPFPWRRSRS